MKFSKVVSLRIGLGLLASFAAAPTAAHEPAQEAERAPEHRDAPKKRANADSLDSLVVIGGAMDPKQERWAENDAKKPLLPVIPEDAFLEDESTDAPEAPRDR
jgi:hypothetical protein